MVMIATPKWTSGSFAASDPRLCAQTLIISTTNMSVLVSDATMSGSFTPATSCYVDVVIIECDPESE